MGIQHINYMNRDYASIRQNLIEHSKEAYPELSDNFGEDASLSSWFIDLMSDCVDSLNYHIDRTFQNTQLSSTTSRSSLMNIARINGVKIPGPKAAMCEVEFSCRLPLSGSTNMSCPDWSKAPVIKMNSVVTSGVNDFILTEDVDFSQQFNSEGYSNRSYKPVRNANGIITEYVVTKTAIVTAGVRKIYKQILSESDITPFMEIMLPDNNVMNIESILFKESANIDTSPGISEFYQIEEIKQSSDSAICSYRFFEVDSLVQQFRFGDKIKVGNNTYVDYTETPEANSGVSTSRTTRVYTGGWIPLRQKFITEYTDNGYMKIIFGPGANYSSYDNISKASNYAQYRMGRIMNNDLLGVLPKAGWTMFVLYNTGGGIEANIAKGAISSCKKLTTDFNGNSKIDGNEKAAIIGTISVTNTSVGIGGKDFPSNNEIKNLIKYNTGSQERCVTLKDYQARIMMMPPKYGAPFRCSAIEENNKIVISLLGMNSDGKLDKALPSALTDNIVEYLKGYKCLTDYVELKSGKIYNIGVSTDVFVDKSYNTADVVSNVITAIKSYFDVTSHDMGEDIYIGDLEKEVALVDGVLGLINLKVYKIKGGSYSSDECPLPSTEDTTTGGNVDNGVLSVQDAEEVKLIDTDSIDSVLVGDYNSMYEILKPESNIQVRVKSR